MLAEGLQRMLSRVGIESHIFYEGIPLIYAPTNWRGRNFVKNALTTIRYRYEIHSLKSYNLTKKEEFIALIDFERKSYEEYRRVQLEALSELGIKTVVLDSDYTFSEIAEVYRKCSIYFLAFYEAFGVPIAELQACGACIFSPSPAWPMAHRLDARCPDASAWKLSENFIIYDSKADLINKMKEIRENYNPYQVFDNFVKNYPHFYEGDTAALSEIIHKLSSKF